MMECFVLIVRTNLSLVDTLFIENHIERHLIAVTNHFILKDRTRLDRGQPIRKRCAWFGLPILLNLVETT